MIYRVKNGEKTLLADISIQPDWNQIDTAQKDFIKNKPDISAIAETTAAALITERMSEIILDCGLYI
jgi:hypothetical protein